MKKISIIILLFLNVFLSKAQGYENGDVYSNEWISYGKSYLKLTIEKNGIYKVTKAEIENAGFSTTGLDPRNYKMYFRGKQMKIKIFGETDGSLDNSDYILFYASSNDGLQDKEVYTVKTDRIHPYYSLYSDETNYFLLLDSPLAGLRISDGPAADNSLTPDPYFLNTNLKVFEDEWNFDSDRGFSPEVLQSEFMTYSGRGSDEFRTNLQLFDGVPKLQAYVGSTVLTNYEPLGKTNNPTSLEGFVGSRRPSTKIINWDLGTTIGLTGNVNLVDFEIKKFTTAIPEVPINNTIPITIKITSSSIFDPTPTTIPSTTTGPKNDRFSMYYLKYKYPRKNIFTDNLEYELLPNSNNKSKLSLSAASVDAFAIEITDLYSQNGVNVSRDNINNILNLTIENTSTSRKVYITSTPQSAKAITKIDFGIRNPSAYDYIILSDRRLSVGAEAYKAYRESANGGLKKVSLDYMDRIYDEFSYGERNPIAIKRFVKYFTSLGSPKNLFLIGKGTSFTTFLKSKIADDFVPSFGYPASDVLFSSGMNGKSIYIPSVPTGRLSVSTNQQVLDYLAKVVEHENNRATGDWQRKVLHLVGPDKSVAEFTTLQKTLDDCFNILKSSSYGKNNNITALDYNLINKTNFNASYITPGNGNPYPDIAVPQAFYDAINAGVGIFTYYGHGAAVGVTHNFGFVTGASTDTNPASGGDVNYSNKGKYPFAYFNGCGIGNAFKNIKDMGSDWVNAKDKGAIAAVSQTFLSYEQTDDPAMKMFYKTWFGPTAPGARIDATLVSQTIGEIFDKASSDLYQTVYGGGTLSEIPSAGFQQTILLGDPAIAILKSQNGTPLPLKLLTFTGEKVNNIVNLNWTTSNEKNLESFEIEKSSDLKVFTKIGSVIAKNINEKNIYSFVDLNKNEKSQIYYRLKMIDFDGSLSFSKVIFIANETNKENLKILGNPIIDKNIHFEFNDLQLSSVSVLNSQGKLLKFELSEDNGKYKLSFNSNLPAGIYILTLSNKNGEKFSEKVIVK